MRSEPMPGQDEMQIRCVLGTAQQNDTVARRFANGFSDPSDFQHWLMDPAKTAAYLAEVS